MDLEVAILSARDGDSAGLVKAMREGGGCDALLACPGCISVRVMPGVEQPGNVLFLVEWESVAAHNAAKETEHFGRFKEIAGPFFGGPGGGTMQHFKAG